MNLIPIANYLAENECGIVGASIFVTEMPSSCNIGILLMDAYHGTEVDPDLPDYYATEFRLVVRDTDFANGSALAKNASALFKSHAGFSAEELLVRMSYPMNLPRSYRRSVGGYWEFEVDIAITFVEVPA